MQPQAQSRAPASGHPASRLACASGGLRVCAKARDHLMGAMAAQNQKGEAFLAVPCSAFTPNWRLEHGGQAGVLWLCCVYRTNPPAAVCNGLGGWKGWGGGGRRVVSFFRGSAFTCLCVTERDGNQDLPSACPPGQFREASCPWGKGLGCEQWAESPAVSEGALCHPAPVGPPWGNLEPGVNGGRL